MANVGYENYNTSDVATMLGVQKCTVGYWCKHGYIGYQDVSSPGSSRPRYMFDEDEVNRVSKLIDKYGKKNWILHNRNSELKPVIVSESVSSPDDYIPDETDEAIGYIKKIRALKIQRDQLLSERERIDRDIDSVEEAIQTMRSKVIEAI